MRTVIALALAIGAFCCGPKLAPPKAGPTCVGELCESDELGEFNCFCPEE